MITPLVVLLGEVRKHLLIAWTYRANQLTTMVTLSFIFLAISFLLGDGNLGSDEIPSFLIGYLVWFYVITVIGDMSWGVRGEMSAGTLEQMAMSAMPTGYVLVGRVLGSLLISTVQIVVMGGILSWIIGWSFPLYWESGVILILTLVGVFGFGFLIAAGTLIFKQFESFSNLMTNVLLFLNGSMLPVEAMPAWLAAIARMMPSTQGIILIRRISLEGASLFDLWQDGSLPRLMINSSLYLLVGYLIFAYSERTAKQQGSLGQY